jgi:hypothetical protein
MPFAFVESLEFGEIVRALNPDAFELLPRSAGFAKSSVCRHFDELQTQVRALLEDIPFKVNMTFDLWTSPNHLGILGVVCQWYNGVNISCALLGMREVEGSHSGANIAKIIEAVGDEYSLPTSKVAAHIGDNASNNGTALDALGVKDRSTWVGCGTHILNLAVHELLNSLDKRATDDTDDTITGPISKIRALAVHASRSTQLHQLWRQFFKTSIKRDTKTRWNATDKMIDSVTKGENRSAYEYNRFLHEVQKNTQLDSQLKAKLAELTLSDGEWNSLLGLKVFLEVFETCTQRLQGKIYLVALVDK